MTDVIATSGLVKTFGETVALDGLDLTVAAGEVHGFLGPKRGRRVDDHPRPTRPVACRRR
jgi:ABC-type transporter Mla maintaining outer membrane lipid asymmetry ATPase subunit MlaF